jgi:hypothetical protein
MKQPRMWLELPPRDKAVVLVALLLAAAFGAVAMALLERDIVREPQPAILDLRSSLK